MTNDIPRLVLDANIMVSALLGRSFSILSSFFDGGTLLMAPIQQIIEVRKILADQGIADDEAERRMEELLSIVEPLPVELFVDFEPRSRMRLQPRGQPDWPVLAAWFATGGTIWSHDKDFFGSGAPVWSTKMLVKQLGAINA